MQEVQLVGASVRVSHGDGPGFKDVVLVDGDLLDSVAHVRVVLDEFDVGPVYHLLFFLEHLFFKYLFFGDFFSDFLGASAVGCGVGGV